MLWRESKLWGTKSVVKCETVEELETAWTILGFYDVEGNFDTAFKLYESPCLNLNLPSIGNLNHYISNGYEIITYKYFIELMLQNSESIPKISFLT